MNIKTLSYLIENSEEIIRQSANDHGLDEENVIGVAKQVVGEKGIEGLRGRQVYLFEKAILPLIENVSCDGWFDEYDGDQGAHYDCKNKIEEARLTHCYREESMLCESCEEEESYRRDHKAGYMAD